MSGNSKAMIFLRYSLSGVIAFVFELYVLYALLHAISAPYYISVAIAFFISTVTQYGVCHWWVFGSSRRPLQAEYMYFVAILITGLILTTGIVVLFVDILGIPVLLSRTIAGIFTGLWDFYLNARFNFRAHAFLRQ